jgi:hypothetical protein
MAVSQLQPGAEAVFDTDRFHSNMSRCVIFNGIFFDRVAIAVERAVAFPGSPLGDGSEYDAEEAKQARYKALGVQVRSQFLNIGVDTQVTWPKQEQLVHFDQYRLVLMPRTKENTQSIHIDLRANRLTDEEARTVINRFLSVLAWCDDQFAISQHGWSGNPAPVAVAKRDYVFSTALEWPFNRSIPQSAEAKRALALYRQGRNAEEAGLSSYAVLSYFKIIETMHPESKTNEWIGRNFEVSTRRANDRRMKDFRAACGSKEPKNYILAACRAAVAHAKARGQRASDVDDSEEITRLYSASYVLRIMARHLIKTELGVSDSILSDE